MTKCVERGLTRTTIQETREMEPKTPERASWAVNWVLIGARLSIEEAVVLYRKVSCACLRIFCMR